MDIHDIIEEIQDRVPDKADRIMYLAEICLFLKEVKESIGFKEADKPWKDIILKRLAAENKKMLGEKLKEVKKVINLNIENKV